MRKWLGKKSLQSKFIASSRALLRKHFASKFYFRSYSQWGEDAVLSQFFTKSEGTYIDVGSGHPVHFNDTYFLYSRGWRGILVDPLAVNQKASQRFRSEDKFILGVAGEKNGIESFLEFHNSGQSKVSHLVSKIKEDEVAKRYQVPSFTLRNIIIDAKLKQIDLLKIDTEGAELAILRSFPWESIKVKVIMIEELMMLPNGKSDLREFLNDQGFTLLCSLWNSHIFVSPEFSREIQIP